MAELRTIDSAGDVVALLTAQHEQIKGLFETVRTTTGSQREWAFFELRRLLAAHEAAEEEIVHPAAQRELRDGDAVVGERLHEEQRAGAVLTELEQLDIESTQFETLFRRLEQDVIAHAEAEEASEFDRLRRRLDDAVVARIRRATQLGGPLSLPEPGGGEPPSVATMAQPFDTMLDRARVAMSARD